MLLFFLRRYLSLTIRQFAFEHQRMKLYSSFDRFTLFAESVWRCDDEFRFQSLLLNKSHDSFWKSIQRLLFVINVLCIQCNKVSQLFNNEFNLFSITTTIFTVIVFKNQNARRFHCSSWKRILIDLNFSKRCRFVVRSVDNVSHHCNNIYHRERTKSLLIQEKMKIWVERMQCDEFFVRFQDLREQHHEARLYDSRRSWQTHLQKFSDWV